MNSEFVMQVLSQPATWWLAMLPALTITVIAVAARLTQGSWLAPGAAWSGFWAGAAWLPILLAPKYPVAPAAVWVIASFVAVIAWFAYCGQNSPGLKRQFNKVVSNPGHSRGMLLVCWIGFAASIAATAVTLAEYGASWAIWLHPGRLVEVTRQVSEDRYGGEILEPPLVRFMLVFTYLGALAGGHAMAWRRLDSKLWPPFAPLGGMLLYTLLTTAKAGILFSLILWLATFSAQTIRRRRRVFRIGIRLLLRAALGAGLVIALFFAAMLLRYGFDEADNPTFLNEQLRNYTCAHLAVFSSWWDSGTRATESMGWGRVSFFGEAALLGLTDRQQGVYQVILSDRYFVNSNVFTVYRGLIADFTLPGALFVSAAGAYLAGLAYRMLLRGARTYWPSFVLTAFYATLLSSHVVNMFGYTTLFFALTAYGLYYVLGAITRHQHQSDGVILQSHE